MPKVLRTLSARIFMLYLIAGLFTVLLVDVKEVYRKTGLAVLNRLRPQTFDYLIDLSRNTQEVDKTKLERFEKYYSFITHYMSQRADAYGMRGYCAYKLGKIDTAISAYKEAYMINPSFFWYPYNLGMIYYKQGRYNDAVEEYQKAVSLAPDPTIMFINTSKRIYVPIVARRLRGTQDTVLSHIREGYKNSYTMLIMSHYNLKNFEKMFQASTLAIKAGLEDQHVFLFFAGLALYELKNYPEAITFFNESIKLNRDNPESYRFLSLSLKALGNEKMAMLTLQKAASLGKDKEPFLTKINNMDIEIF